ncbi:MAG: hypothetical protein V1755_08705 [Chloroflexota bacterium]
MAKTVYIRIPDDLEIKLDAEIKRIKKASGGAEPTLTAVLVALIRKAMGQKA